MPGWGPKEPSLAIPSEQPVISIAARHFLRSVSGGLSVRGISPLKVPKQSVSKWAGRNG